MRTITYNYYVGDFETTVYEGQTSTEVWASAVVPFYTEDVTIHHSIDDTYAWLCAQPGNTCIYYHNLKFDGAFWVDYLIHKRHMKQAVDKTGEDEFQVKFQSDHEMKPNTFKYVVSDMGAWYFITIRLRDKFITIRDSLKLLPFSVKRIGDSFKTKHRKLDMEYEGLRYAGCEITDKEKEYIANDVLVVKEALEIMFDQGHKKLTIGSCCLDEFKSTTFITDYKAMYPNVYEIPLDRNEYGYDTVGDYIHKSYRGGWCYLCRGKENKLYGHGTTADVNSLYPSMMSSESGNKYPMGAPRFWKGNFIPDWAYSDDCYFFVRVRTRFYLKEGYLPWIQIKGNSLYDGTASLETSDWYNKKDGKYYHRYTIGGIEHDTRQEFVWTMTDYALALEHYELVDFEILDGCVFSAMAGIFDEYINKYRKIKMESKGALRELAKLFLNNLYGKMASSKDSSFKVAYEGEDGVIHYMPVREYDKLPGYIPIGSAITSYARNFTIRAAQKNFHGVDKPGFIYADTDSIHCDLPPEEIVGIRVDDKAFCAWKLETCWDYAIFARQKTYIEHVTHDNLEPIPEDMQYLNIKCAGMPERCKQLFNMSLLGWSRERLETEWDDWKKLTKEEQDFVLTKRTVDDFKVGLRIPGKLLPCRVPGGIILKSTSFEMLEKVWR